MSPRIGVVTFPGTLDDKDAARAVRRAGGTPVSLWHSDASLQDVAAVVLPGGFSYGDYLRAGAIARFAPVMAEIMKAAAGGLPVLGICNGFQVLCEAGMLPGTLIRNERLRFICRPQRLRIEAASTAWTGDYEHGQEVCIPVKNIDGRYVADERTLDVLETEGRVVLRYLDDNPNGSLRAIAGITNERGTVVGMMPHPEHAIDLMTGPSCDGLATFTSAVRLLLAAR